MFRTLVAHFEEYDRRIFWTALWSTVFAVFFYIYFLGSSVYSVILRKQAEVETTDLYSRISGLEATYALLDKEISLELAHEKGFVDISVPRYVSREAQRDGFTLREASGQ